MKITKLEWTILAITAMALIAMGGYFVGSRSAAEPVTITAQTAAEPRDSAVPSAPEEKSRTDK